MSNENCLQCGLPESDPKHTSSSGVPEGWHPFRGLDYLEALEDALHFAQEKRTHQWESTGWVIDTSPSFAQKVCTVCHATNWGGKEDGLCFGNYQAELALIAAHNRGNVYRRKVTE